MRVLVGAVAAAALALGGAVAGCGAVDDLVRAAGQHADDLAGLARSRWVPEVPAVVTVTSEQVRAEADSFLSRLSSVPTEDRAEVVQAGCHIWTAYDVEQDPDKIWGVIRDQFPNAYSYREQVADLVSDFRSADTTGGQAVVLGRAAVCFAADEAAPG
ncbi:hypothetical protein [Intrasporangium flavum]|uniref:hypothetical protein n=1 Tax=Intrasporangium flavum TaxID=1428657 RepID=UPI001A96AAD4|nr:hypothetical protein [Intrasporangium flavum]